MAAWPLVDCLQQLESWTPLQQCGNRKVLAGLDLACCLQHLELCKSAAAIQEQIKLGSSGILFMDPALLSKVHMDCKVWLSTPCDSACSGSPSW